MHDVLVFTEMGLIYLEGPTEVAYGWGQRWIITSSICICGFKEIGPTDPDVMSSLPGRCPDFGLGQVSQ